MKPASSKIEFALTAITITAGSLPVLMITFGGYAFMISNGISMADMWFSPPDPAKVPEMSKMMHSFTSWYIMDVIIPALIVIALIWVYSVRRYPRLANRIGVGLAVGLIGTFIGGEPVRLLGVWMGWFPSDMPVMFGKWITGKMTDSPIVTFTGSVYHIVLNGSTFALLYALIAGRAHWGWGVAWILFFEMGMMALPPVPLMFGPFGIYGAWPGLFIASLLVHLVFGAIVGLLAQRYIRDKGTIFSLLQEAPPSTEHEPRK